MSSSDDELWFTFISVVFIKTLTLKSNPKVPYHQVPTMWLDFSNKIIALLSLIKMAQNRWIRRILKKTISVDKQVW